MEDFKKRLEKYGCKIGPSPPLPLRYYIPNSKRDEFPELGGAFKEINELLKKYKIYSIALGPEDILTSNNHVIEFVVNTEEDFVLWRCADMNMIKEKNPEDLFRLRESLYKEENLMYR